MVEAAARREPHAAAVTLGRETLAYRDLDELANVLAQGLNDRGTGTGVVAIALARSPETAALILATQKAGLAYLPLDPRHPRHRLELMLEDAKSDVLVHDGTAGLAHPRAISLHDLLDAPSAAPLPSSGREDPDRLVYVLYTSGSTGRPKGVAMTQRPLCHLIEWQVRRSRPAPRTLQLAPLSFDVSFQEMFSTWAAGGELILMPPEAQHDPDAVLDLLARAGVERLFAPCSRLQQIAEVYDRGRRPTALKELVTAGEQVVLTPPLRAFCADLGATLDNQYGPTETHVVTALLLDGDPLLWPERPSIGRPLPHVELEIRDDAGRVAAAGAVGELWIGGAAPARGYVGRDGDPFLACPDGRRFYRSGDLVRRVPGTGEIEFHGRADDQVKIRGFRVELGEVEAALAQLPSVAAAAATVTSDESRQRLVALVVPRDGARPPRDSELRRQLRERLPDYMIPAAFVTLAELPTTPSGKVDRKRLADAPRLRNVTSAFAAPGTPLEHDLAALWRELLGVDAVGVDDDFVELGGDSLLSVRLLQQIRRLGYETALDDLLASPTIRGLAATLRPGAGTPQESVDVRRVDRTGASAFAASIQQEQLWILQQRYPDSPAYNVYSTTEIGGPLDGQALRSALASLVSRHEALRTVYRIGAAGLEQVVRREASYELDVRRADGVVEAWRLARAFVARPFVLDRDVFRALLAETSDRQRVLVLCAHHIAADGVSLALLKRELGELYVAALEGRAPSLTELPAQYLEYADWQRRLLASEHGQQLRSGWLAELSGLADPGIPFAASPRAPRNGLWGKEVRRSIPEATTAAIRDEARERRCSPFVLLLAAYARTVATLLERDAVVVAVPLSGRSDPAFDATCGMFVNTMPLRIPASRQVGREEQIAGTKAAVLQAVAGQDVPLGSLVRALGPRADASRWPLGNLFFALEDADVEPLRLPGASVRERRFGNGTAKVDLSFQVDEFEGRHEVVVSFDPGACMEEGAHRLVDEWLAALDWLLA